MDVLIRTETKFLQMHCMTSAARPRKQFLKKSWKKVTRKWNVNACERALRDKKIYVPSNYKTYIEEARPKQPYKVEYVKHDFFKSYNDLTYYSTMRPGHKVGDPVVTDIRQLRYTDRSLEYKLDYCESDFLPLPQRCGENTGLVRRKYAETPRIKKSKYDDLQALKAVLPQDCHAFYDGLPHYTA